MSKPENKGRSLDDLLKKNGSTPDDAFEKEAREGFEMLENTEEAFALKASTDARVNTEVFSIKKRERTVFYWVAAASILLFVSFSIYFFKDVPVTQQPLVVNDMENKTEVQTHTIQPVITEKLPETKPEKKEGGVKAAESGNASSFSMTRSEDEKKENESLVLSDQGTAQVVEPAPQPEPASPQIASVNSAPAKKDMAQENRAASAEDVHSGAGGKSEQVQRTSSKKAKQSVDETSAPSSAAYDRFDAPSFATYPGGTTELKKVLKEKLEKKNTDLKFSATLFIDRDGIVDRVEFFPNNDLSNQERKVIRQELLTLQKFQVPTMSNETVIYELHYEP